ncbi:hypothetical protein ES703_116622 [subsurface metagenome]
MEIDLILAGWWEGLKQELYLAAILHHAAFQDTTVPAVWLEMLIPVQQ